MENEITKPVSKRVTKSNVMPELNTQDLKVPPFEDIPQRIYVGPNLLGLSTYTVIETVFTEHIANFIERCPDIEKMFVKIAEMAEVEKRLKEKGTLEHRRYQNILAFKNTEEKGDK